MEKTLIKQLESLGQNINADSSDPRLIKTNQEWKSSLHKPRQLILGNEKVSSSQELITPEPKLSLETIDLQDKDKSDSSLDLIEGQYIFSKYYNQFLDSSFYDMDYLGAQIPPAENMKTILASSKTDKGWKGNDLHESIERFHNDFKELLLDLLDNPDFYTNLGNRYEKLFNRYHIKHDIEETSIILLEEIMRENMDDLLDANDYEFISDKPLTVFIENKSRELMEMKSRGFTDDKTQVKQKLSSFLNKQVLRGNLGEYSKNLISSETHSLEYSTSCL